VVRIHQEIGDQVGIVVGVVDEDVGRQRVYGFGTAPVPEDRGDRGGQPSTSGTESFGPLKGTFLFLTAALGFWAVLQSEIEIVQETSQTTRFSVSFDSSAATPFW
jgi:hypothetical protein